MPGPEGSTGHEGLSALPHHKRVGIKEAPSTAEGMSAGDLNHHEEHMFHDRDATA